MAQVVETVDLNVPVDTAYEQWTRFEDFPRFLSLVKEVTRRDDTHFHWTVSILEIEREFDTIVTEQQKNERIAWTSTGGEVDHGGVVTFHKLSDTTSRLAVQIDWEPEGFVESAGAALDIPNRAVKAELVNFKTFVEGSGVD